MTKAQKITVSATIDAPVEKVWDAWNSPADIMQWNSADPTWHCPKSENNLVVGGTFNNRMEAKDGSMGFDFTGTYYSVEKYKEISYTMPNGRKVTTLFSSEDGRTNIQTTFDPETQNDPEFQKQGWQSIMNNFVKYVETKS